MQPKTIGYIFSGAGHLALIALGLATFAFAPKKIELLDSIPVEIVTELPSESKQGAKTGEKTPEVKKQVDKVAEKKPVEDDDDDEPIAKEKVKTSDAAPPPPPPPKVVVTPPPKPVVAPPKPVKQAALESDNLEEKLAEIEAAKKKQELLERQKQAKLKAEKEAREEEEKERREEEKAEKLKQDKLAKEKVEKDAKERETKERLDRLKNNKFDPSAIAAKTGSNASTNDQRTASRTEKTGAALAPKSSQGTATGRAAQLTSNELEGLKAQIAKCWSPPSLVQNAKSLVVAVEFSMTQDGYVSGTPSVANRQAGAEFNAAAGAAVRAVQRCQPYKMPQAKYDSWRELRVNFRPEDLM